MLYFLEEKIKFIDTFHSLSFSISFQVGVSLFHSAKIGISQEKILFFQFLKSSTNQESSHKRNQKRSTPTEDLKDFF